MKKAGGRASKSGGADSASSSRASSAVASPVPPTEEELKEEKRPCFKSRDWQPKLSKKKTLKQILAAEKAQQWPADSVQYGSIDAPPSFKPAKKYSDVLGLPAKYTDPQTKLRFATTEEFACVRSLPNDIVSGYLALRNARPVL